jgi:hypothetical protein
MFYREGPARHLCRTGFIISKTQTEFVTKVGQKCEESMYRGDEGRGTGNAGSLQRIFVSKGFVIQ